MNVHHNKYHALITNDPQRGQLYLDLEKLRHGIPSVSEVNNAVD